MNELVRKNIDKTLGIGNIDIDYELDEDSRNLTIIIADEGKPFDPLAKEDPDIALIVKSVVLTYSLSKM